MDYNVESEQRIHANEPCAPSSRAASQRSGAGDDDQWYCRLLRELPAPALALDPQGNIVLWNCGCEEITRYESAEIVGNPRACEMLWPDPAYSQHVARQWSFSPDFECEVTCKDGQVRYIQWHVVSDHFPVPGWAVLAIGNDITKQIQAQKELREYRERLRHVERMVSLGMPSATLAHELTQPLSVIQLASQTALTELEKLNCPDAVKQDLQASLTASGMIAAIISRFRDFARQSTRTKETEVHISTVAEWTIRLLEQTAQQAKVSLLTKNLDALPVVRMRENELEQTFFALVENAIQAADGTKDRYLLITGALHDDWMVLQFEDNCGGIEPAHLSRIFKPFFTTKPPGKGTGLGLCIARGIVRDRGGQISVQSRYGEGTTFTVTLPRN